MKNIFKKIKNVRSGFVLLYAVVIASIVLAITVGISSVALREVLLSTSGKDANDAFFAADAGVECALYLDKADPNPFQVQDVPIPGDCAGVVLNYVSKQPRPSIPPTTIFNSSFTLHDLAPNNNGCAIVTINKKTALDDHDLQTTYTDIISKGYNTFADQQTCLGGTHQVERELEVQY